MDHQYVKIRFKYWRGAEGRFITTCPRIKRFPLYFDIWLLLILYVRDLDLFVIGFYASMNQFWHIDTFLIVSIEEQKSNNYKSKFNMCK